MSGKRCFKGTRNKSFLKIQRLTTEFNQIDFFVQEWDDVFTFKPSSWVQKKKYLITIILLELYIHFWIEQWIQQVIYNLYIRILRRWYTFFREKELLEPKTSIDDKLQAKEINKTGFWSKVGWRTDHFSDIKGYLKRNCSFKAVKNWKNKDFEDTNNKLRRTCSETAWFLDKKQFSAELELFSFSPIINHVGEINFTLNFDLPQILIIDFMAKSNTFTNVMTVHADIKELFSFFEKIVIQEGLGLAKSEY